MMVVVFMRYLACTYPSVIEGCTDPNANNYDPLANVDDGSCTYTAVLGCTDPLATNYNNSATVDDGSCTYCSWHEFRNCVTEEIIQFGRWAGPSLSYTCSASNNHFNYITNNVGTLNVGDVLSFSLTGGGIYQVNQWQEQPCYEYMGLGTPGVSPQMMAGGGGAGSILVNVSLVQDWAIHTDCPACDNFLQVP